MWVLGARRAPRTDPLELCRVDAGHARRRPEAVRPHHEADSEDRLGRQAEQPSRAAPFRRQSRRLETEPRSPHRPHVPRSRTPRTMAERPSSASVAPAGASSRASGRNHALTSVVAHLAPAPPHPRPDASGRCAVSRLLLVLALLVWLAGYSAACALWPFAACRRCDGAGKRRSPSGRAWRTCPVAGGSGRRLRTGRHALLTLRGKQPSR